MHFYENSGIFMIRKAGLFADMTRISINRKKKKKNEFMIHYR